MRKFLISAFIVAGLSGPVLADAGSPEGMQRALFIAHRIGVVAVQQVQFDDGKWQIEGRDPTGRNIEVQIDDVTGAIVNVDRWW